MAASVWPSIGYGNEDNGRYSGQVTLLLPTNVDIRLNNSASIGVECFHLANCALSCDASHSNDLGM